MKRTRSCNALIVVIALLVLTACSNNSRDKAAENAPVAMIPTPGIDKSTVNTSWSETGQSQSEPMIIKTGTLSLEVADIDSTYTEIMTVASQYGGYVLRTDIDRADSKGTIVITVAAAQFETAMIDLRALGLKVQQDTATGEDVTTQYVDLESRLHSLEATRERILTFLDQARNVEEAIQVNDRLAEIETQIEQIRGQMNYLEGRSAQSTITVYLYSEAEAEDKTEEGWSASETLHKAWDAQKKLVKTLASAVIWIGVFLGPYLLVATLGVVGWRRWRKSTALK